MVENDRLRKLLNIKGNHILCEFSQPIMSQLEITLLNTTAAKAEQSAIIAHAREWFDLERDLSGFYKIASKDKLLSQLSRAYPGLRIVRIHDLFQALCWAILGQQINIEFAYTLQSRIIENYGQKLAHEGTIYWLFPQPEIMATLTVRELRQLQLTNKKSEYIIGVANAICKGIISKKSLQNLPDFDTAQKQLLKLHGVGPWTANYVLMRCLGSADAFPLEDIGLHNAIKKSLHLPEKPTIDKVQKLAGNWVGWRAYAAFYLYRSLQ